MIDLREVVWVLLKPVSLPNADALDYVRISNQWPFAEEFIKAKIVEFMFATVFKDIPVTSR
jgi:hypothetical protein